MQQPKPYRIGLVAGSRGPNDQQFEWMLSELKRRVHDLPGTPVLLLPARNLGNPPSWINRRLRPEGTTIIKDDLPNWKAGAMEGPRSVVNKLQELEADEVWCFAGEGQTAFGASVGSRVYQHAVTHLDQQQASHYKLIVSWILPTSVPTDKDSLKEKKAKRKPTGVLPWINN